MEEYNKLNQEQKAKLLDKLVNHAENIEGNFMVMINSEDEGIRAIVNHAKHFIKILEIELKSQKRGDAK